jgi:hypothetical protein
VPITKVIVPDLPPPEVPPELADDDDELEEPPQAASATTEPSADKTTKIDLVFLLIKVLLLRGLRSCAKSIQNQKRLGEPGIDLINPQHDRPAGMANGRPTLAPPGTFGIRICNRSAAPV